MPPRFSLWRSGEVVRGTREGISTSTELAHGFGTFSWSSRKTFGSLTTQGVGTRGTAGVTREFEWAERNEGSAGCWSPRGRALFYPLVAIIGSKTRNEIIEIRAP